MIDDDTIARMEARIAELERWKQVHDEWHNDSLEPLLDEHIKALDEKVRSFGDLIEEIMAALERAGIPRWPGGQPKE